MNLSSPSLFVGQGLPQAGWHQLLESWSDVMTRFIKTAKGSSSGEDIPYWYNEYSNVGFLAAAVWKLGGVAIQEYTVDRVAEDAKKSKGRCDLWICLPEFGMEYAIEAKFSCKSTPESAIKDCRERMNEAMAQIRTYDPTKREACQQMAAVFMAPYNQSASDAESILDVLWEAFSGGSMNPNSVCAVYRPPVGSNVEDEEKGIRSYYPGVALFAQL